MNATEVIVHCEGSSSGDQGKTLNLVRAAARAGVRRVVYISVLGADQLPVVSGLDRAMFGYFASFVPVIATVPALNEVQPLVDIAPQRSPSWSASSRAWGSLRLTADNLHEGSARQLRCEAGPRPAAAMPEAVTSWLVAPLVVDCERRTCVRSA